jgi:hypothetical protein
MNARTDDLSWRHPVFGDRDVWKSQTLLPGWFEGPLIANRDQFTAAAVRAIEETASEVGG